MAPGGGGGVGEEGCLGGAAALDTGAADQEDGLGRAGAGVEDGGGGVVEERARGGRWRRCEEKA